MLLGLILIGVLLYFIFSGPYGAYAHGCGMRSHMHGMGPHPDSRDDSGGNSARAILDERYVKGEISDEEYKTKKANLS